MDLKASVTQMADQVKGLLSGGGAASILGKLREHGLGDIASSWVGLGKNLPISTDQLSKVLGHGTIASIAAKLGLSHEEASKSLADVLPHAIDHMTPDGQPPSAEAAPPDPAAIVAKFLGGAGA
ncbi:MAG TPA: YidB family protein [Kofleriaceae bacterium]|nr:YidB family protein [Kofleriaceae bacterium]